MQNAKFISYTIPIILILTGGSYACGNFSVERVPTPSLAEQAETQNKQTIVGCKDKIDYSGSTVNQITRALKTCADLELIKVTLPKTNSGTVAPASTGEAGGSGNKNVQIGACEYGKMEKVEGIEFHYTATPDTTTLQSIKGSHEQKFGAEEIGYHYVIKPDGEITNTRDISCVAVADKWSRNNYRFIQIAFVGDDKPSDKQTVSILKLTKKLQQQYNLPVDAVSAHSEWGPKSKKESLDHWYGSKHEFIKKIREQYQISIYGKESDELTYMWRAWGDRDFIATIFAESRMNNNSIGDNGQSFGYCQIHKGYQPGWYKEYMDLKSMPKRLNYCHELYTYAKGLKGGVGSRFHGFNARDKHLKNISIF